MFRTLNTTIFAVVRNLPVAMLLLSGPAFGASESDPVTTDNWLNHPKTIAVRNIYKSVEDGISFQRFKVERRAFEYCEPHADVSRVINVRADGLARKYQYEGGSADSAIKVSHYYDDRGTLRFVFARAGAVNNTVVEYRIYFDEAGERFWHDYRLVAGPGYTFPSIWPEEWLIREPGAAFVAKNSCADKQ
ncbi:MAG: hypothetical protein OEN55_00965 [Alphaproteobacteria bacterium]|nr:hypothetical protein [Alphaproteobacteria bacterium]